MKYRWIWLILFFFVFNAAFAQPQTDLKQKERIDQLIDSLLREWHVPGLALGVVYKGRVWYVRGYGYRNLEKQLPVESGTLFPIGSNTKLFTATMACILARQGKLNLDQPATEILPALHFSNSTLNGQVTLKDMLSHRTGLPRYDGIWIGSTLTRAELISRIAFMKPVTGLREEYLYNNMMYTAVGAIIEKASGASWENTVRKNIFGPLEMQSSCLTRQQAQQNGNYALAYFERGPSKELKEKTFFIECEGLAPAGNIRSSALDMTHWMLAELDKGKWNGKQALDSNAVADTYIPYTVTDKTETYPEFSNALYCLGRNIQMYKGRPMASHGGALDGFFSSVTLFPADSLGVFVAVNADHARPLAQFAVPLGIYDRLMGLELTPWSKRYQNEAARQNGAPSPKDSTTSVKPQPGMRHPLSAYAGSFQHPVYGRVHIQLGGTHLVISFRNIRARLYPSGDEQCYTLDENRDMIRLHLRFLSGPNGKVTALEWGPAEDPAVIFTRITGH